MIQDDNERRLLPRYESVRRDALLGRDGPSGFQTVRAVLHDISTGGAALVADCQPPPGEPIWIRLANAASDDWTRAVVVGLHEGDDGQSRLHVQFLDPCTYEFFRAAVVATPREAASLTKPAPAPQPTRERPRPHAQVQARENVQMPARDHGPHFPLAPANPAPAPQPVASESVQGLFHRTRRLGNRP